MRCRVLVLNAELTVLCLKVRACHMHLLHAAFCASVLIFWPLPSRARWKTETKAAAAEEANVALPPRVTNASLDAWRLHSSLLSHGHKPPLPPNTSHARIVAHTCESSRRDSCFVYIHTSEEQYTGEQLHLAVVICRAATPALPSAP